MVYQKYEVGPYNLHIIKTDKFKTVTINVNFRRLVVKEEITIRNFLSEILTQSSLKYPSNRLLKIKAQELYGLNLSSNCFRTGNYNFLSFSLTMLNEKYVKGLLLTKSLDFLTEILFNPHIINKQFDEKSFKIIKHILEASIKSLKDNKDQYARLRMLEAMDDNSPTAYNMRGYLADLDKITPSNLCSYYQSVIKSDLVDIFVLGDVDIDEIKTHVKHYFKSINTIKRNPGPVVIQHQKINRYLRTKVETEAINQSNLSIGCQLNNVTKFESKYVMPLYNDILGGSGTSLLFNSVREKESLAYYIGSRYNEADNLLIISSGINSDNFKKAVKLIKVEMDNLKKGDFTDEALNNTKMRRLSALKYANDFPSSIIDRYFYINLLDDDNIEEQKKQFSLVTKDDIKRLSKKIKMAQVFLLEGRKNDE